MNILWKKLSDLLVTHKLSIGKGAYIAASDYKGNQVPVGLGAMETRAAAATLTADDSGKTIFLASTTAFALTLPLPFAGARFKFVVTTAPSSGSHTVVTNGSANIIKGSLASADLNAAADTSIVTSADTVSFGTTAIAGDFVELISDGTSWLAFGNTSVYNAVTLTQAS